MIGLGYSNGANILASVMLSQPELFDEAVLMHPLVPWTPEPQLGLAGKRVLITAGRLDTICPPALTQTLADYLISQGVETDLVWHSGGHEIQQSEVVAIERFVRETVVKLKTGPNGPVFYSYMENRSDTGSTLIARDDCRPLGVSNPWHPSRWPLLQLQRQEAAALDRTGHGKVAGLVAAESETLVIFRIAHQDDGAVAEACSLG